MCGITYDELLGSWMLFESSVGVSLAVLLSSPWCLCAMPRPLKGGESWIVLADSALSESDGRLYGAFSGLGTASKRESGTCEVDNVVDAVSLSVVRELDSH